MWSAPSLRFGLTLVVCWSVAGPSRGDDRPVGEFWRSRRACGVTCLYLQMRIDGREVAYDQVLDRIRLGATGATLPDIRSAAEALGYPMHIARAAPRHLADVEFPVIAHLDSPGGDGGHFVVITGSDESGVRVIDGTTALRTVIPADEFRRAWTGYLLLRGRPGSPGWVPWVVSLGLGCAGVAGWVWRHRLGLPAGVAAAALGAATPGAAAEFPAEARRALAANANALSPLTVTWERTRTSPESLETLVNKWGVVPDLLDPVEYKFVLRQPSKYVKQTRKVGKPGRYREVAFETSFDGELIYRKGKRVGEVERGGFTDLRWEKTPIFFVGNDYLRMAGYEVPNFGKDLLTPIRPVPLALLEQGAAVRSTRGETLDGVPVHAVELDREGTTHRFWFDPARGWAVVRYAEIKGGVTRKLAAASDLVDVGGGRVWLPRRIQVDWHSWPTGDATFQTPIVTETMLVKGEISRTTAPDAFFKLTYEVGTVLADNRPPEAKEFKEGYVEYTIPARPEDLEQAIQEGIRQKREGNRPPYARHWFWIANAVVVVGVVAVFIVRRRRGATA